MVVRGYCTYVRRNQNEIQRVKQFYYKENPDRWAAETQSDMLWLTRAEWRSLLPGAREVGSTYTVARPIARRFFTTIGIDYMEGSVNSLVPRELALSMTLLSRENGSVKLRLDGYAELGKRLDLEKRNEKRSRGCEVRVLGFVEYDRESDAITRFDVAGLGDAWGNKMEYVRRAIRIADYPWSYAIACELVTPEKPIDFIPPYNLLHYGEAGKYFGN